MYSWAYYLNGQLGLNPTVDALLWEIVWTAPQNFSTNLVRKLKYLFPNFHLSLVGIPQASLALLAHLALWGWAWSHSWGIPSGNEPQGFTGKHGNWSQVGSGMGWDNMSKFQQLLLQVVSSLDGDRQTHGLHGSVADQWGRKGGGATACLSQAQTLYTPWGYMKV